MLSTHNFRVGLFGPLYFDRNFVRALGGEEVGSPTLAVDRGAGCVGLGLPGGSTSSGQEKLLEKDVWCRFGFGVAGDVGLVGKETNAQGRGFGNGGGTAAWEGETESGFGWGMEMVPLLVAEVAGMDVRSVGRDSSERQGFGLSAEGNWEIYGWDL